MQDKTKILFVAFEFPPLGSGGVQRSLKFVKYLPEFQIEPIVITAEESDYPILFPHVGIDDSLLPELKNQANIIRIHCKTSRPLRNKLVRWMKMYFSVSEHFKYTWKPGLLNALAGITATHKPQAVYISLPPFAMGELWLTLLRKSALPLIVDFRDAWSQWGNAPNGSYIHYRYKVGIERRILKEASKVVFSSRQTMDDMAAVHPSVDKKKFSVITNGYDETLNIPDVLSVQNKPKIIIGYVGSFYYHPSTRAEAMRKWWQKRPHRMLHYTARREDWLYRSPYFFLKAMRSFLDANPSYNAILELHFAGHTPDWLKMQVSDFGLTNICRHHGYLKHTEVLKFQHSCDALLITSSKVIGGRDYSIAGKTFEYFTIGKPILAFVTEGAQKDILVESGMAVICDPDDISASVASIAKLLEGEITLKPNLEALKQYHRRSLTGALAGIINDAISKN